MRRRLLVPALLAALPLALIAQKDPTFDVVSIKPNRTNQGIPAVAFQPGGRVMAGNIAVRQIIVVAYGLEDPQLVNAPEWTGTERFTIDARTSDGASPDTIRLMLRSMLAERFGFAAHQEKRDLQTFALTIARPDKRLGPRLRVSGPECAPIRPPDGVPMPPPPPPPPPGGPAPMRLILPKNELSSGRRCGSMLAPGWMTARSIAMTGFATTLTQVLGRSVIDETGLTGEYDLDVIFTPEGLQGARVGPPPASVADAPSLSTALQDDLGLRLEPRRGPVDVLVIDRIERPTEN